MTLGERIKMLREKKGWTQEELGQRIGVKNAAVHKYESGRVVNLKQTTIEKLAQAFGVKPSYLLGYDDEKDDLFGITDILPPPSMRAVPRLGEIACGEPILTPDNIEDTDLVPDDLDCDFTLQAKGDSMINARINDGDIVCIKQTPVVENGEIAAVLIDDMETETTLKRFSKTDNAIILMPENGAYQPLVFTGKDMNKVRVLGKAVYFISKVV